MNKPHLQPTICEAALKAAEKHGWNNLTMEQIAKAAKMPVATVRKFFKKPADMIPALVELIDGETRRSLHKTKLGKTPHDRLFEIMMARFDALQNYRSGILAIIGDLKRDPQSAMPFLKAQWESMTDIILTARPELKEPQKTLAAAGLYGVYQYALFVWSKDSSADMSKTMAALDRGLRYADKAAKILFRDHK